MSVPPNAPDGATGGAFICSKTPARFDPLFARTKTFHRPVAPIAYDCVKLIVIRDGSAILFSEFGEQPVSPGDVVLLGANVLCGSEPEGHITVTTLYLDTDYVMEQFFWQHAAVLADRLDAEGLAEAVYSEPAQILHLGEDRTGMMMPWLDELVALSVEGRFRERFHRMQALWFSIADVFVPFVRVSPVRLTPSQRVRTRPALPRDRRFAPLREEVRRVADLLQMSPERPWSLRDTSAHLSMSQFGRVFVDAYGLSPLGYLAMLRAKRLAELLRESDLPVEEAMRRGRVAQPRPRGPAISPACRHDAVAVPEAQPRPRIGRWKDSERAEFASIRGVIPGSRPRRPAFLLITVVYVRCARLFLMAGLQGGDSGDGDKGGNPPDAGGEARRVAREADWCGRAARLR